MIELAIIGMGPAAFSAAIYAARYKISTKIFGMEPGGQMGKTHFIENYPGFPEILGSELSQKMQNHAKKFGVEIIIDRISKIKKKENKFKIYGDISGEQSVEYIILATGSKNKKLGIPGEKKFFGKGVTYCFTCDGPFFRHKKVGVVGGGDAAVRAAIFLAEIAEEVSIFLRRDVFRAEPVLVDNLRKKNNIKIFLQKEIKEILGQKKMESIILNNDEKINLDGLFIEIGSVPESKITEGLGAKLTTSKHIIVDWQQQTSINNLLAVGDVSSSGSRFEQIVTAISEGAMAAKTVFEHKQKNRPKRPPPHNNASDPF